MRISAAMVVVALAASPAGAVDAESSSIENRLKAEFIERFTRFIEWPPGDARTAGDPFRICVYGESRMTEALEEIIRRQAIQDRSATLLEIDDPEESTACHVLFVAGSEAERLDEVLARTADRPILTVGDTPGFARRGVLINFYRERGFVRFEVNPGAAEKSGLRFSSRLLRLATLVGEGEDGE